jgi:hypothetical protein
MNLRELATDPELRKEGVWVTLFENMDVKVRPFGNPDHLREIERRKRLHKAKNRTGNISAEIEAQIGIESLPDTVWMDWRGSGFIDIETGEPLPYSYKNALAILKNEDLEVVGLGVINVAREQETFRRAQVEESEKNLKKPSPGTCDGKKSGKT